MKYAVYLPNVGEFADARLLAALAYEAEQAGWDGVFIWDELALVWDGHPLRVIDPWIALTAIALCTQRIYLGPMVTPVARRRPAKLARETATLDHLSAGRLILGVGLGAPVKSNFTAFGEDPGAQVRAQKLDESLTILAGLWRGEPFDFRGEHFSVHNMTFLPKPFQSPRIPIWVAGRWPNLPPVRRAAQWDGMFPVHPRWPTKHLTPDDYRDIAAAIRCYRDDDKPFDLAGTGTWAGDQPPLVTGTLRDYEEAGVTWWLQQANSVDAAWACARTGPPR